MTCILITDETVSFRINILVFDFTSRHSERNKVLFSRHFRYSFKLYGAYASFTSKEAKAAGIGLQHMLSFMLGVRTYTLI